MHHTPYTIHHTPYTIRPSPYTLHPTPYIIHHTPYTLNSETKFLNPEPYPQQVADKGGCELLRIPVLVWKELQENKITGNALTPNTVDPFFTLGACFPRGGPVLDPVLAPSETTDNVLRIFR